MDTNAAESAAWIKFLAWLEVNKKRLIIWVSAVVGVALVGTVYLKLERQKEERASEAISDIKMPYSPAVLPPPGSADELLKVAEDYRSTIAAPRAMLVSAGIVYMEGNYPEAEKRFARVIQEYPNSPWMAEAALGVAKSFDAGGKTNEAIAKYEEIRRRYGTAAVIDDCRIALARLYEATKPEEAYRLYDEVMRANPPQYSGLGNEAGMHQEELVKKHPELAKLREPVTPPPLSLTNRMVVTNRPMALNTNLLRQSLTNAATKLSNAVNTLTGAVSTLTNRLGTNLQLLLTPPAPPQPAPGPPRAPAPAPAPPK